MNLRSRSTPEQRRTVSSCGLARKERHVAEETSSTVDHQSDGARACTMILTPKEQSRADLERMFQMALAGLAKDIRSRNPNVRHNARQQFLEYPTAGGPTKGGGKAHVEYFPAGPWALDPNDS
jgi:hypothetical protein